MQKTFLLSVLVALMLSAEAQIQTGVDQMHRWLPFTRDKKIALVVNQTSRVGETHLVDTLLKLNADISCIFAPEHGFRGNHGAGEKVHSGKDIQTGLPIVSLYGNHKKPTPKDLKGVGLVIFDIQDVGARFYTYISTMHYVMEACAEQNIPFLVLDRPNPNGHYVDGPILDTNYSSFVGMHPVPVVHGMTVGEYARMINGEGWLRNGIQCSLEVITLENWNHQTAYELPVAPSPNLPNAGSIAYYPALCFFEGTNVSVGRGTSTPFQVFGKPEFKGLEQYPDSFTPQPDPLAAPHPKYKGQTCYGMRIKSGEAPELLDLSFLVAAYNNSKNKSEFFNDFFLKLAGTPELRRQIEAGMTSEEIGAYWRSRLNPFLKIRKQYLLYPDQPR